MIGSAAAIIQPEARKDAAETRYTDVLTFAENSEVRFSPKSLAKKKSPRITNNASGN